MVKERALSSEIRQFVLDNVEEHRNDIGRLTAGHFGISRQSTNRHIRKLIHNGELLASGKTKARTYELKPLVNQVVELAVTSRLEEDVTWRQIISPYMGGIGENVLNKCQYGFTEMVNNVVSHSAAKNMTVAVRRNPIQIRLTVSDNGVGVFHKIQQAFGYDDPRHALLELAKGKVTSDPTGHTGEGIFFTSKMFDAFSIWSGNLFYARLRREGGWLIEAEDRDKFTGTFINMEIHPKASQTIEEVFDQYTTGEDRDFSKTHVPIMLAKYEREQLLSRSQARRVLARFERFKEVMLDFQGVELIGQAFADEIFRVFRREHPEIRTITVNTTPAIDAMINRVSGDVSGTLPLL